MPNYLIVAKHRRDEGSIGGNLDSRNKRNTGIFFYDDPNNHLLYIGNNSFAEFSHRNLILVNLMSVFYSCTRIFFLVFAKY